MVVPGSIVFSLGLSLCLQEVLSETSLFFMEKYNKSEDSWEEIFIQILMTHKTCDMRLYLNSDLVAKNFGRNTRFQAGKYFKRPEIEGVKSCYYMGKIPYIPYSWVAMTTCQGIEGLVYDGISKYRMRGFYFLGSEEWKSHGFISIKNIEQDHEMKFLCGGYGYTSGGRHERDETPKPKQDPLFDSSTHFVEMLLVVDYSYYVVMGRSMTKIYMRCQEIMNVVNAIYQRADLFVTIMYIDVETRPDVIKHDMEGFSNYVADHFDHFENIDNVQLLTQKLITIQENGTATSVRSQAKFGAMCEQKTGHGMVSDKMGKEDIESTASLLSLAIARNLGVVLDEMDELCFIGAQPASNCSVFESIKELLRNNSFSCLKNKPDFAFPEVPIPPITDGNLHPVLLLVVYTSCGIFLLVVLGLSYCYYQWEIVLPNERRRRRRRFFSPRIQQIEAIPMQELRPAENVAQEESDNEEDNSAEEGNVTEEENIGEEENVALGENVAAEVRVDREVNVPANARGGLAENVAEEESDDEEDNSAEEGNVTEEENVGEEENVALGENVAAEVRVDREVNVPANARGGLAENVAEEESDDEEDNSAEEGNVTEEENIGEEENVPANARRGSAENVAEEESVNEEENFAEEENVTEEENVASGGNVPANARRGSAGNVTEEESVNEEENAAEEQNVTEEQNVASGENVAAEVKIDKE